MKAQNVYRLSVGSDGLSQALYTHPLAYDPARPFVSAQLAYLAVIYARGTF